MVEEKKGASMLCEEPWHALDEQCIYGNLQSKPEGLDGEEAAHRLAFYGPNALPAKKPPTIWAILLHQVLNPLIFILVAAAVASIAIGEASDAIFIVIVVVLNSGLGAYQEYNAEKSAASLQGLLKIKATVRRGAQEFEIPSEGVVPGDIVLLESGNKVPADLRLLQVNNLAADESFLTGESIAAEKRTGPVAEDMGVSERHNMAFAGSTITSGRGMGIVVATGSGTQVGLIAKTVAESESAKPPLVLRMEKFIRHISLLVLLISAGLALLLHYEGYQPAAIFFFVVALAVSAIPEGLPVALTVALSIATKRMSKRNVIVRKLTAVESLGSCTVIASDKTGTLTVNQQTARQILLPDGQSFILSGEGYNGEGEVTAETNSEISPNTWQRVRKLSELSILANEASLVHQNGEWKYRGDSMDVAFLAMGWKLNMRREEVLQDARLLGEIPYESERKFSAVFYEREGVSYVAAKGAVETILDFCTAMQTQEDQKPLDRQHIELHAEAMAGRGLRVLAVAGGRYSNPPDKEVYEERDLSGLVFYGLAGFIDPLRPEAAESVNRCRNAGIRVLMITGDHPSTAGAIAGELGLTQAGESVVSGRHLSEAGVPDSPAFEKLVSSTHVFARVSPAQKLEIVDVLIRQGEFVAVTGDGVNDAPALRRANIGVAMGSGTDVAKEVGLMIVADDNFASIVAGVEEGRFAYDNVRKVIYLLISTGLAEVLMFLASILAGLPIPLLAVQLLWLNLVTNGIQDVALAFEGGEPGAMKRRPRRPDEPIFNSRMISQTVISGLTIGALAFASWYWHIKTEGMDETYSRNAVLLLMVLLQNVHVFNCRSEYTSAFRVPVSRNYMLVLGVILAQGVHILSMQIPFMQNTLRVQPVDTKEWLLAVSLALMLLMVMEIFKVVARKNDSTR